MNKANVFDVARYILMQLDSKSVTTWKLQKLVYYAQAWSLVWDEQPLFSEKILAWSNGPVVRELYDIHKGQFKISNGTFAEGNSDNLSTEQKDTIDQVVKAYGNKTGQWLSLLTHAENPWKLARASQNLQPGERGSAEITLDSIVEYYESLDPSNNLLDTKE